MNPAGPPAIRAESLVKSFCVEWRGGRWPALSGVDLCVARGTVCGVVGPNGSGKSTTLKLLAALTRPDSGRVEIGGLPAGAAAARGWIGYLPELPAWPDYLSGFGLLKFLAEVAGLPARAAGAAAHRVLAATGLADSAGRRVTAYSKGMRQRLGVAQALLADPRVVLLDEPASGLDPRAADQLAGLVRDLAAQGRAVVLTSHFLPGVEEMCDHVVVLDRGRVLFAGERRAVAAAGGLSRLYRERTRP